MIKTLATIAAAVTLTACAQSPDAIMPVSMGNAFGNMPCRDAQGMINSERQTLANLSVSQKQAVAGDAVGVLLIGVPVSSLTGGDKAGIIAASKGKIIALESRLTNC